MLRWRNDRSRWVHVRSDGGRWRFSSWDRAKVPDDSLRTLQNGVEEMAGVVHAGIPWVVSAVDQDPHGMRGIALGLCEMESSSSP